MADEKKKTLVFPPILVIKRREFEKVFKEILKVLLSEKKITPDNINSINRELAKWLITGMQNVDFDNDRQNQTALDDLVNDLWTYFYRDLNMKVRKHRTKFRRKTF